MTLLTTALVVGVSCDVRSCSAKVRLGEPVPSFSDAERRFEAFLLCEGWARRSGITVWWYCPAHADRATRCIPGRWGRCSPWCPVHGDGQASTWATEEAKRLAGQRNMLTDGQGRRVS